MPTLVLLNGPPGAGKTTLAQRLGAVMVDVDALGGDRSAALALCRQHLAAGYDVVVPQYVGRLPFIEVLASVAEADRFVQVVLRADPVVCAARFRGRRATGEPHVSDAVPDERIDTVIAEAIERLAQVVAARPGTVVVDADDGAVAVVRSLLAGC